MALASGTTLGPYEIQAPSARAPQRTVVRGRVNQPAATR